MSLIVAVVGATGIQGGSVIATLLQEGVYKVRGITRNVNSSKAQQLIAQGAEMVEANLDDEASLVKAFSVRYAISSAHKLL